MQETASVTLYRQQAERITFLAAETIDAATRLELLEIAASFQKLANYASANSNFATHEAASESA